MTMPTRTYSGDRQHALQRSLVSMTLGMVKRMDERRAAVRHIELTERTEQFQIPITGTAYQGIAWIKAPLVFETLFFGASGQRDSDFERPQVSYGYVIDPRDEKEPPEPIVLSLAVEFHIDDQEATYGCVLHIGVHSPTFEPVDFEGYLHLTVQGWGAPKEDETESDA